MKPVTVLLLITAAVAEAQVPLPQYFRLKEFLELSDQQFVALFANLTEMNTRNQDVARRMSDLQREVAIEMGRDNPDPMEIGTRQVEIEKICRIVRDENRNLFTKNLGVLSEAQRTKLSSLDEIGRRAQVINEAQALRLMGEITTVLPNGQPGVVRINISPTAPTLPGVGSGPCTLSQWIFAPGGPGGILIPVPGPREQSPAQP